VAESALVWTLNVDHGVLHSCVGQAFRPARGGRFHFPAVVASGFSRTSRGPPRWVFRRILAIFVPPSKEAQNAARNSHRGSRIRLLRETQRGGTPQAAKDQVCELLRAWSDGDTSALERLTPIVYDELHRLARRYMRGERPGHSLQTTALVNEAYMRLVDYDRMQWQNRAHFFAVSAQLMRRILVEHARRHNLKRGGGVPHVSLEEAVLVGGNRAADLVALDDAMTTLAQLDPRKAQVVEMRFFGGLNVDETADVLHVSPATVMRDWNTAKAWLYRELAAGARDGR
jgi:RNA polymerase sigma-70 factor, ECF subfamily